MGREAAQIHALVLYLSIPNRPEIPCIEMAHTQLMHQESRRALESIVFLHS